MSICAIEMEIGCAWHVSNVVFYNFGNDFDQFVLIFYQFWMSFWSLFGALGVIKGPCGSLGRLGVPRVLPEDSWGGPLGSFGVPGRSSGVPWVPLGRPLGRPWGPSGIPGASPGRPRGAFGSLLGPKKHAKVGKYGFENQ